MRYFDYLRNDNCAFPGDKSEWGIKKDHKTMSMCLVSSIRIFGSKDLHFYRKRGIYLMSMNQCRDIQYGCRTILERSLNIWYDSGSINNFKIIQILAGLMIALNSFFHENSNKTNNIKTDYQQNNFF